ncbi:MAG: arylsulfatase [Planctomycetaceae bacterium]|nr:arylsulfatase [Planctomycetaceae bacterium]
MKRVFVIAALVWEAVCHQVPCPAEAPPNIVYILADDLGLGDVRSYTPQSPAPTPNIDRIAVGGMRFTNAHSPSAVCTPTRYGILTGRYAWRTRLKAGVLQPYEPRLIDPQRATVAEMLHEQGYTTAAFGKWHLGMDWSTTDGHAPRRDGQNVDHRHAFAGGPTDNGFETYFGDGAINFPPYAFMEDKRVQGTMTGSFGGSGGNRVGPIAEGYAQVDSLPLVTNRAVQAITDRAATGAPFFIYLALSAPHSPIVPPDFIPDVGTEYDRFIATVDWSVGQILDALEAQGVLHDTIVFFGSDNGADKAFATSDSITPGFVDGTPLRGQKGDIWEAGHRIPFIVQWSGGIPTSSTSNEYVELVDFFATAAAIAGYKWSPNVAEDSYNLLPILTGRHLDEPLREAGVNHSHNGTFAIRQFDDAANEWKLIFSDGSGGFTRPKGHCVDPNSSLRDWTQLQLYNLATDPGEQNNLLEQSPSPQIVQRVRRMQALLQEYIASGRSFRDRAVVASGDGVIEARD